MMKGTHYDMYFLIDLTKMMGMKKYGRNRYGPYKCHQDQT